MKPLNELKNYDNQLKIDSLTAEETHEWYLIIKNSLSALSRHYSTEEIDRIKSAVLEYERRHGLL